MLTEFDQNTMANMTAALEDVCNKIPVEKDGHGTRKSIADAMFASAKSGNRTYLRFSDRGSDRSRTDRPAGRFQLRASVARFHAMAGIEIADVSRLQARETNGQANARESRPSLTPL